jgi:uncharacterized protein DUF3108
MHYGVRMGVRICVICFVLSAIALADNWETSVTAGPPGSFPPLRSLVASYHFGWAGITAASGEVRFSKKSPDRFQFDGTGHTIGFVRALWKMDVTHHAIADADTLRPIEMEQTENFRSKKIETKLAFSSTGVTRVRNETKRGVFTPSTKQLNRPNMFDLHGAFLYLRSQPLRDRSVQRIVVFPAASSYLATITVTGHEKISVPAGSFNAIKCDLQLNKVGKKGDLEPHKKFRRGTIWISDDADRILLRVEAQIFVGTVFAELQSVRFEGAKK